MTDVRLYGDDTGCPSCGHATDAECGCTCCPETPMSHQKPFCPDCGDPLEPDGPVDYFCRVCQRVVMFTEAILLTCAGGAR